MSSISGWGKGVRKNPSRAIFEANREVSAAWEVDGKNLHESHLLRVKAQDEVEV